MAYQVKRNDSRMMYEEDLELVDEQGNVMDTIHICLDPDVMAKRLSEKHLAVMRVTQRIQEVDPDKDPVGMMKAVGDAVRDMLEAVFGVDDTEIILNFYHGRYMEIIQNVLPFVLNTVVPEMRRMARDNKKAVASGYKRPTGLFGRK